MLGVRNLPMAIFVGGNDTNYNRHAVVAAKGKELDELEKTDPGGYVHMTRVYEGMPHWMNRKDAEALPWMTKFSRQNWPKKVVWFQDDVTHSRFYWLKVTEPKQGQKILAEVSGQTIRLSGDATPGMTLRLRDEFVNLDEPVKVMVGEKVVFEGKVVRSAEAIRESLQERADKNLAATASLKLVW